MRNFQLVVASMAACLVALTAGPVLAQQKGNAGLVCWKDKSGKTVGCGDKVPPEYQDNANSVLNQQGMTVNKSEASLTSEQRQAQKSDTEQRKADAQKREEDARRDRVLLDSFTNEKEIELKRVRDIEQMEVGISALQLRVKSLTERQAESRVKMDGFKKENKPVPAPLQQDYDRLTAELVKNQEQILQKRKEIGAKNLEFDAMKKRFLAVKGGAAAPAAAPAKK
jgi:hypothetical protein